MVERLQSLGREVEYEVFEDEGHGSRAARRIARVQAERGLAREIPDVSKRRRFARVTMRSTWSSAAVASRSKLSRCPNGPSSRASGDRTARSLAELLLDEGTRSSASSGAPGAHYADLAGSGPRISLIRATSSTSLRSCRAPSPQPHEVYNLAAPSFVPTSWDEPVLTAQFAAVGVTAILEAIRAVDPTIRFYQASSSEIFGEPRETPRPRDAARTADAVRRRQGVRPLHLRQLSPPIRPLRLLGILYNHESPRRPLDFVTRKVADGVARDRPGARGRARAGRTSTRGATGGMRRTTCARCGSCCSRTRHATT